MPARNAAWLRTSGYDPRGPGADKKYAAGDRKAAAAAKRGLKAGSCKSLAAQSLKPGHVFGSTKQPRHVGIVAPATVRHGSVGGQKAALTIGLKQVAKGRAIGGTKGRELAHQGAVKARIASGDSVKAIGAAHRAHKAGVPGFKAAGGYAGVATNDLNRGSYSAHSRARTEKGVAIRQAKAGGGGGGGGKQRHMPAGTPKGGQFAPKGR